MARPCEDGSFLANIAGGTQIQERFEALTVDGLQPYIVVPKRLLGAAISLPIERELWTNLFPGKDDETWDLASGVASLCAKATGAVLAQVWKGAILVFDDPLARGADQEYGGRFPKTRLGVIRPTIDGRIFFVSGVAATVAAAIALSDFCSFPWGGGGFACDLEASSAGLQLRPRAYICSGFDGEATILGLFPADARRACAELGLEFVE